MIAGIAMHIVLRCCLICFFSFPVHFSPVLRGFMRSCMSPLIARTSLRMNALLLINSFTTYRFIIMPIRES